VQFDYHRLKKIKTDTFLCKLVFLCLFNFTINISADEIVLSADEWCPFNCNPNHENQGLLLDIAKFSFARKGHSIKYVPATWKRAIRQVMKNQHQGLIGAAKPDAPDLIYPKNYLHLVHNKLYVLRNSDWKYTGIKSLESINLGVVRNYYYGEVINAYIEANKHDKSRITIITDDTAIGRTISMLKRNRIDAFIEVKAVVQHYLSSQVNNQQIKEAGEGSTQDIYIGFSPNNPHSQRYADALDEGIVELRKTGKLEQLYKKYNIEKKSQ
jgi:polar amino acid transport system substrate-binding protein